MTKGNFCGITLIIARIRIGYRKVSWLGTKNGILSQGPVFRIIVSSPHQSSRCIYNFSGANYRLLVWVHIPYRQWEKVTFTDIYASNRSPKCNGVVISTSLSWRDRSPQFLAQHPWWSVAFKTSLCPSILNFTITEILIFFIDNLIYYGNSTGPRTVSGETAGQSGFIRCCLKHRKNHPISRVILRFSSQSVSFRHSWMYVSTTFSKPNMNVFTHPLCPKGFAQSIITIVNLVSLLYVFLKTC